MFAKATIFMQLTFSHSARPGSVVDKNTGASLLQLDAAASSGGEWHFFIVRALVLRLEEHSSFLDGGV